MNQTEAVHFMFDQFITIPENYRNCISKDVGLEGEEVLLFKYEKIIQKGWLLTALAPIYEDQISSNYLMIAYEEIK